MMTMTMSMIMGPDKNVCLKYNESICTLGTTEPGWKLSLLSLWKKRKCFFWLLNVKHSSIRIEIEFEWNSK